MRGIGFGTEGRGVHEPLIDEELWDRVHIQLIIRGKARYRTQRHHHILRGLVKSGCGLGMTAEFHDGGKNSYLRCISSASPKYKGCGQMGPRLDAILAQIEEEILPSLVVGDEDLATVRDELSGLVKKGSHVLETESHIIRTRLAHVKDRSQALLDIRVDGEITMDEFEEKKAALALDQAKLTGQLEEVEAVINQGEDDLAPALALANQLPALWTRSDRRWHRDRAKATFALSSRNNLTVASQIPDAPPVKAATLPSRLPKLFPPTIATAFFAVEADHDLLCQPAPQR